MNASINLFLTCTLFFYFYAENVDPMKKNKPLYITVFIHGIISLRDHLTLTNLVNFISDNITDSSYARAVELIRKDSTLHLFSATQEIGLYKIELAQKKTAAAALAYIFHYFNTQYEPQFDHEYYTLGWSGLISSKVRNLEAELIYTNLKKLVQSYQNRRVSLRVIGYSHGASMALSSAYYAQQDSNRSFHIDELILLGMPVIQDDEHPIHSPFFKKVIHIYSYGDNIQCFDIFSSRRKGFFSQRSYHKSHHFNIPKNLIQIDLRITGIKPKYKNFFNNAEKIIYPSKRWLTRFDPGHTELWSFGWSISGYREHFPLNPLPAVSLVPFIVHCLDTLLISGEHYIANLNFDQEYATFINKEKKEKALFSLCSHHEFSRLKEQVNKFRPRQQELNKYKTHVKKSVLLAEKERLQRLTEINMHTSISQENS